MWLATPEWGGVGSRLGHEWCVELAVYVQTVSTQCMRSVCAVCGACAVHVPRMYGMAGEDATGELARNQSLSSFFPSDTYMWWALGFYS